MLDITQELYILKQQDMVKNHKTKWKWMPISEAAIELILKVILKTGLKSFIIFTG